MLGRTAAFIGLAAVVALVACGSQDDEKKDKPPGRASEPRTSEVNREEAALVEPVAGLTAENYPRVGASISLQPLARLMAARALGLPGELRRFLHPVNPYTAVALRRRTTIELTFPLRLDTRQLQGFPEVQRWTYGARMYDPYAALIGEEVDLILVARKPSNKEQKAAEEKGRGLDVHPFARDALVFVVNKTNPVKSLTLQQIVSIYTGKVTNWQALGGEDEAIQVFTREAGSDSRQLVDQLVMKGETTIEAPVASSHGIGPPHMLGEIDSVSENAKAIAYSLYYDEHFTNPHLGNRLLGVGGVMPTSETIANRSYPLTTEVYVITREGIEADSPTAKLRDWILSDEGQRVVAQSGHVPIRKN